MASEIHYTAAQLGQASASGRLDLPLLMGQICPVPLPSWLSDSGKGIQIVAAVHSEAQLTGRWGAHGRQVLLDTSSVKVFPARHHRRHYAAGGGHAVRAASWKVRGQEHASFHDVATRDMIRQLPARLRAPGRCPRPLLGLARPVPVRPGRVVRPVVGALPPAGAHRPAAVRPRRIPGPHPARSGRPADNRDQPLRPPPVRSMP